jgi:hypothetical protein
MRAIVTCECCGYRQAVARPIRRPEQFHVICHGCEGVLLVEVTSADLRHAAGGQHWGPPPQGLAAPAPRGTLLFSQASAPRPV